MEDSIMDDSVFDDYGDESDGFEPVAAPVSPACARSIIDESATTICESATDKSVTEEQSKGRSRTQEDGSAESNKGCSIQKDDPDYPKDQNRIEEATKA
jgi:hypothetical protein